MHNRRVVTGVVGYAIAWPMRRTITLSARGAVRCITFFLAVAAAVVVRIFSNQVNQVGKPHNDVGGRCFLSFLQVWSWCVRACVALLGLEAVRLFVHGGPVSPFPLPAMA